MMQHIFELRYQVYCLERGFLPAAAYPQGAESDEFDAASEHFCEFDAAGGVAAYARLVRASDAGLFPFQQHCAMLLHEVSLPDPEHAVEVSRLIMRGDQRRARGPVAERAKGARTCSSLQDTRGPYTLTLPKLYRQMVIYSLRVGIRHWFAAMERPLARSLMLMGYPFRQISPELDYYGPVATYLLDLQQLQERLQQRNPGHLAWLTTTGALAIDGSMPPRIRSQQAQAASAPVLYRPWREQSLQASAMH